MKRAIFEHLIAWKNQTKRKPLIIRGARQVGKTFVVRQLESFFDNYIEINFERKNEAKNIFDKDLSPERIKREISLLFDKKIVPGRTLLFLDEIQAAPNAIAALRYFYEEMPDLHVIAAGSLIDFALEKIGVPVGRVSYLYMHPMSFFEFLQSTGHDLLAQEILNHSVKELMSESVHNKLLDLLGVYMAVGGMPEAVQCWVDTQDLMLCSKIHDELITSYRDDFQKYAKKFQLKYVDLLFNQIPHQISESFRFSKITGEYRKRELAPSLDLLVKAGVVHQVFHSAGNGVPLGAEANLDKFKVIFLDVALSQAIRGLKVRDWILNAKETFVNKGEVAEAFVGQEMLAYALANQKPQLYYWYKESKSSNAEVDYLVQKNENIIPVEVKSAWGGHLKSVRIFLENHAQSPYAIRFSTHNYSVYDRIYSYPLYAVSATAFS